MARQHDVEWIIERFRPLVDKIDIDNIPEEPHYQKELLSDTKQFIQLGMETCVLSVCRKNFSSIANGFYTFSCKEHEGQQVFFLNIYINNILFASNSPVLREKRRSAIMHEFTHCIAAFLSIGRIKTKKLVDGLIDNLAERVRMNDMEHYQIIMSQIGDASSTVAYFLGIYNSEHFQLKYEDFEYSYSTVYKNLILDKHIFERYFTKDMRNDFGEAIRNRDTQRALTILNAACTNLLSAEAISADFLSLRLREEFLEYYLKGIS
jgi:hypothetical protein